MVTKASDETTTGPNFTSAEYAEQWSRGKRLRAEASEALTRMMLDFAGIQPGDRVIELAAGMGDLAVMTARRVGPSGFVLATDVSSDMLTLAAETVREAGFGNVETRIMDAENIDVAPDSFNARESAGRCAPGAKAVRQIRGDGMVDCREKSVSCDPSINR
jgi:cyclopropane fatty-acyl-phospholipid synthase-like methyltransferase